MENNRAIAVARCADSPRVLIVDGDTDKARHLADALRAAQSPLNSAGRSGFREPSRISSNSNIFCSATLRINSRPRAMELVIADGCRIRRRVHPSRWENSFGVGGYSRSPVEQMLPVRMEHNDRQELPTVALMIVLDRSGSMTAMVAGQTKMALANQGAALALNVLSPRDDFGVLAVDTRAHVLALLARHGAKEPIAQKVLSVTAGGRGIYVYTSLAGFAAGDA